MSDTLIIIKPFSLQRPNKYLGKLTDKSDQETSRSDKKD